MREHSAIIVDQAALVSTELIRAAILWHEIWYDGLEEASKHYFADGNIPGMFEVLEPLHELVEQVGPSIQPATTLLTWSRARIHCGKLHSFRALATIFVSLEIIYGDTPYMVTRRRSNRLGIYITR